jgi:hypothetical protein
MITWIKPDCLPACVGPVLMGLKSTLPNLLGDFGRRWEKHYIGKFAPRNRYNSGLFLDTLQCLPYLTLPKPNILTSVEEVEAACHNLGLGSLGFRVPKLESIRPPGGITAMGVNYDTFWGCVSGSKSDHWVLARRKAKQALKWIQEQGFTFKNALARSSEILYNLDAFYIPGVRVDRGEYKQRVIFAGQASIYILEQMMMQPIKNELVLSSFFGYNPLSPLVFQIVHGNQHIITGDFKAYDQHLDGQTLMNVWEGLSHVYGLPEDVMSVLAAINTRGPMAIWRNGTVELQSRSNINPSGSGAFAIIMSVACQALLQSTVADVKNVPVSSLSYEDLPINVGDDHVLRLPPGISLNGWVAAIGNRGQNAMESEVNSGQFKFLRQLYDSRQMHVAFPIVASRFRNALCPESFGINARPASIVAMSLRGQLLPLAVMSETFPAYKHCFAHMRRVLLPKTRFNKPCDLLALEYSDAQLSQFASELHANEDVTMKLFMAKKQYNVSHDSRDCFVGL